MYSYTAQSSWQPKRHACSIDLNIHAVLCMKPIQTKRKNMFVSTLLFYLRGLISWQGGWFIIVDVILIVCCFSLDFVFLVVGLFVNFVLLIFSILVVFCLFWFVCLFVFWCFGFDFCLCYIWIITFIACVLAKSCKHAGTYSTCIHKSCKHAATYSIHKSHKLNIQGHTVYIHNCKSCKHAGTYSVHKSMQACRDMQYTQVMQYTIMQGLACSTQLISCMQGHAVHTLMQAYAGTCSTL